MIDRDGMVTLGTRLIACAALLLGGDKASAQTGPAKPDPPQPPMVNADTPVPASPAKETLRVLGIRRPDVDLAPPPPVPFIMLTRVGGDSPVDYLLEIDQDGTVRYEGHYNVCVQGEKTKEVPGAIVDEARRLIRKSRVFDRRFQQCSSTMTDDGGFEIYFAEPPPGSVVRTSDACPARGFVTKVTKLAQMLEQLVDATPWINPTDRSSCRPWTFWRSIW
jgi:hypothetical protein